MCITKSSSRSSFDIACDRYFEWAKFATAVVQIGLDRLAPNRGNRAANLMLRSWQSFVDAAIVSTKEQHSSLAIDVHLQSMDRAILGHTWRRSVVETCVVNAAEFDSLYCPRCTSDLVLDIDGEVVCCNRLYRSHPVVAVLEVVEVQP